MSVIWIDYSANIHMTGDMDNLVSNYANGIFSDGVDNSDNMAGMNSR